MSNGNTMRNSYIYSCLLTLLLVSAIICGCTNTGTAADENSVEQADISTETITELPTQISESVKEETAISSQISASRGSDYYIYPEAYEKYDLIYFNDASGRHSTKNDFNALSSVEIGDLTTKSLYTVVDISNGKSAIERADSGKKFLVMAVKMAPVGDTTDTFDPPVISDFLLIDGSQTYEPKTKVSAALGASTNSNGLIDGHYIIENVGDIYSGQKIYGTLYSGSGVTVGEKTGWLVFEVPDSFKLNKDTYLKMNVGDEGEAYLHLSSLRAEVSVKKSPSTGNIEATFKGGNEAGVVRGIEIVVTKPDGTVKTGLRELEDDEFSIPVGVKASSEGSAPGGGLDHVVVYLIRMDGEKFIKYEGDLAVDADAR